MRQLTTVIFLATATHSVLQAFGISGQAVYLVTERQNHFFKRELQLYTLQQALNLTNRVW